MKPNYKCIVIKQNMFNLTSVDFFSELEIPPCLYHSSYNNTEKRNILN